MTRFEMIEVLMQEEKLLESQLSCIREAKTILVATLPEPLKRVRRLTTKLPIKIARKPLTKNKPITKKRVAAKKTVAAPKTPVTDQSV